MTGNADLIAKARQQVARIHDKSRRERLIADLADALELAEAERDAAPAVAGEADALREWRHEVAVALGVCDSDSDGQQWRYASAGFAARCASQMAQDGRDLREVNDRIEKARAAYRYEHGTWDDLALAVAGVLGFDIYPPRANREPIAEALESGRRRAGAAAGFAFEDDDGRGAAPHLGGTVPTADIFPKATS